MRILDDRPDQTTVGRADGLQPKTIETLRMLRLGDHLLDTGVRVFDICLWQAEPGPDGPVQRRVGREVHYPASAVDLLHPFILLCHQGMVEGMFVQDLAQSGVAVERGHTLESFRYHDQDDNDDEQPLEAIFRTPQGAETSVSTHYLVGCDGARSRVRQGLAGGDAAAAAAAAQGTPVHESYWAVLDGELATDFPDLWSKTVVSSAEHGSVLIIPRERNLTRFYIEVRSQADVVDEAFVRDQARKVLAPYTLEWRSVEWFGHYRVAQRVAARFTDGPSPRASDDTDEEPGTRTRTRTRTRPRVFIAGDASHTHSPKAAQGMNTSMHDAWNLGWKLNLAVRGLARGRQDSPGACSLLATYEAERKKIAHDLIAFDYEHANRIAGGDADALAANFRTNIGFIAGVGCVYGANVVNKENKNNQQQQQQGGAALPGHNLPPAKATRYVDDNPVDVQLAIPMLGQFRVLAVVPAVAPAAGFLARLSDAVLAPASLVARLAAAADRSYQRQPRPNRSSDAYYRPERYLAHSNLFTFGLISTFPIRHGRPALLFS